MLRSSAGTAVYTSPWPCVTGAAPCLCTGAGGAESTPASQPSSRTEAPAARMGEFLLPLRDASSLSSRQPGTPAAVSEKRSCVCCPVLMRPPGAVCSSVLLSCRSGGCGACWEVLLTELRVQNCLQGRLCQILGRLPDRSPAGRLLSLWTSALGSSLCFSEISLTAFCSGPGGWKVAWEDGKYSKRLSNLLMKIMAKAARGECISVRSLKDLGS